MKQMAEKISPSNILPPPMLSEQVLHLNGRKATEKMPAGVADKLRDESPQMEEIDGRRYPKGAQAVSVPALKAHEIEQSASTGTDPFIPDHVDVEYVARLEPKSMQRPKFIDRDAFIGDALGARTIFGPDNRKVFYSTAYPWRCNGKVESPLGSGSGTMVGPRHLLTCSHIIDWRPDGTVGWLKFTPMYYNGSAPYGNAWATRVYFKHKVQGPTIDSTEAKYDYVAVVLDRTIGAATGWLGTKGYTDSWDGGAYWTHVGYPDDLPVGSVRSIRTELRSTETFGPPTLTNPSATRPMSGQVKVADRSGATGTARHTQWRHRAPKPYRRIAPAADPIWSTWCARRVQTPPDIGKVGVASSLRGVTHRPIE
jgi:V8-like Glu-specific endopeptidase